MAQAGNYEAAMAKLDEAEAVNHTPDDMTVITQTRQYIGLKAGNVYPAQTRHITPQFPHL